MVIKLFAEILMKKNGTEIIMKKKIANHCK